MIANGLSIFRDALLMARASLLTYDANPDAATLGPTYRIDQFSDGLLSGFVASNDDTIILAFRGSDNIDDWLIGLDATQVEGYGGEVHKGISAEFDKIWPEAYRVLRSINPSGRHLFITGHSLGGALAMLAGSVLTEQWVSPSVVYTFGAPHVFNPDAAKAYSTELHRMLNIGDIVPHLPPGCLFGAEYSSPGAKYYLPELFTGMEGDTLSWLVRLWHRIDNAANTLNYWITEHSISTYLLRVKDAYDYFNKAARDS